MSAVVYLYENIDTYSKHCERLHTDTNCCYSVVVIVVFVKSASADLCVLSESVKQLADRLPDNVIANGVVVNVSQVSTFLFKNTCGMRKILYTSICMYIVDYIRQVNGVNWRDIM